MTSPTDIILYCTVRSLNVELVDRKKNRSLVFSGSRIFPTLGSILQWETRQASFPTRMVGSWVGIFLSPLNTNDVFYLSHPHTHNGYLYSCTPDRDFRCFYSCAIILSNTPVPAKRIDTKRIVASRRHAGRTSIRDVIVVLK